MTSWQAAATAKKRRAEVETARPKGRALTFVYLLPAGLPYHVHCNDTR